MAIISADEFAFQPDPDSTSPLWLQLRRHLAYLISAGRLKPGDQLPKIRELAVALSINFNTVNKAYLNLTDEGYIESKPGRGTVVRQISEGESAKLESVDVLIEDCVDACLAMGLSFEDVSKRLRKKLHEMERERNHGSEN